MVYTYFERRRRIAEEEQKGKVRVEYGKKIIKELFEKQSRGNSIVENLSKDLLRQHTSWEKGNKWQTN